MINNIDEIIKNSHRYQKIVNIILKHEGALAEHPNDPGGITKYGISKRSYPDLDIKGISQEDAKRIYYNDWWMRYKFDKLPDPLALYVFDLSVLMGSKTCIKQLQKSLNQALGQENLIIDGILGQKTFDAIEAVSNIIDISAIFKGYIVSYFKSLIEKRPALKVFWRGWMRRIDDLMS